jgi:hypothetical protein
MDCCHSQRAPGRVATATPARASPSTPVACRAGVAVERVPTASSTMTSSRRMAHANTTGCGRQLRRPRPGVYRTSTGSPLWAAVGYRRRCLVGGPFSGTLASVDLVEKVCVFGERIVDWTRQVSRTSVRIRWAARYSLPAISVESIERCVLTEDRYSRRPPDIVTATLGFPGLPLPCGALRKRTGQCLPIRRVGGARNYALRCDHRSRSGRPARIRGTDEGC